METTVQIITKADLDRMTADVNYKGMVKIDSQPRPYPPVNRLYIITSEQIRSLVLKIYIKQKKAHDKHIANNHHTIPLPPVTSRCQKHIPHTGGRTLNAIDNQKYIHTNFFLESLDPSPQKTFESDTHPKSFKNFQEIFLDTLTIDQRMKAFITNHLST